MGINSLSDLFMEELGDLLNMEQQLMEALPKMATASYLPALKIALENCLKITKEHAKRLENIFSQIGQKPRSTACQTIKKLIAEAQKAIKAKEKSPSGDALLISVGQRVQQYEISRYKSVREHAADLSHTKIVELFTKTLEEDRAMNFHFNELAQGMINIQATSNSAEKAPAGGFYISEERFKRGIKKKTQRTDAPRFSSDGDHHPPKP